MTKEEYVFYLNKISITSHAIRIFITTGIFFGALYLIGIRTTPISIIHIMYYMAGWSIFVSFITVNTKVYQLKSALANCLLAALMLAVTHFI